jgi:hypothetical protein
LGNHLKTKRPKVAKLLAYSEPAVADLMKLGFLNENVDFDAISKQMPEALEADRVEAALDNSIWASLEWKWHVFQR